MVNDLMTENQKELEELLLKSIERQIASAIRENDNIPETALALIELWKSVN